MDNRDRTAGLPGAAGILLGALLDCLYRPCAFPIGQRPVGAVISRAISLKGFDQMYLPVGPREFPNSG